MIWFVSGRKGSLYRRIGMKESLSFFDGLVQFDSETTGLDCHTDRILTLQLGNRNDQVVYDWQSLGEDDRRMMKEFLESGITLLGVNLSFDLTFLYKEHIYPASMLDCMIADQLIYLGYPRKLEKYEYEGQEGYEPVMDKNGNLARWELHHSLKSMAKRWIGYDMDKTVRGEINKEGLTDRVIRYAATDVMYLEDILDRQTEEMKRQDLLNAFRFECETVKGVAYVKYCGMHMDTGKWQSKMASDRKKLDDAREKLDAYVMGLYGNDMKYKKYVEFVQPDLFGFNKPGYACSINWSSSEQVSSFFQDLGINVVSKDNKRTVEEKQIAPQANDFPVIPLYLDYQEAAKVTSTYGNNWLKAVNPSTGRIHADVKSIGTNTSRMSSGGGPYNLNQQNLPNDKVTRGCFTPEEGNVLMSCDFQAQESRLLASVSQDKAMTELFTTGCKDTHSLVAYMSFPDKIPRDTRIEDVKGLYPHERNQAKKVEFAINYGGNEYTIAANLVSHDSQEGMALKEAKKIYDDYMRGFPGIRKYQEYCRKEVMRTGYILMNPMLGHRAHVHDLAFIRRTEEKMEDREFMDYYYRMRREDPDCETVKSVNRFKARRSELGKASINYRIQNRGACCTKLSLIRFFNAILKNGWTDKVKICGVVHDEIIAECPEDMGKEVSELLVRCMGEGGRPFCPGVPVEADVQVGDHWIH